MMFLLSILLLFISSCYTELDSSPEWTMMLYIAADNNLFAHAEHTLIRSTQGIINTNKRFNLFVMCDGRNKEQDGDKGEAAYYILEEDGLTRIKDLGEHDSGSKASHTDFIDYGIQHFPAKKYCMIFWGHTSGIDRVITDKPGGISRDEGFKNGLKVKELAEVIKHAKDKLKRKVDVVGIDACSLMFIEVAYEMKDYADFLCGSQDKQNAFSWDYESLIADLWKTPKIDARELCISTGRNYQFFYEGIVPEYKVGGTTKQNKNNDTFSAVDLSKMGDLKEKIRLLSLGLIDFIENNNKEFAEILITKAIQPSRITKDYFPIIVLENHYEVYQAEFSTDILSFVERAKKEIIKYSVDNIGVDSDNLVEKCNDVIKSFNETLTFGYSKKSKEEENKPNGLSIRETHPAMMLENNVSKYIKYAFDEKASDQDIDFFWAKFIQTVYDKTYVNGNYEAPYFRYHDTGKSREELVEESL